MFDRILHCQLSKAFKDVDMDIDTYCGWYVPKEVVDKMLENADRINKEVK